MDVSTTALVALEECSHYIQSMPSVLEMLTVALTKLPSSPASSLSYPVVGGILKDEAIMLLRHFYVQENEHGK